MDRRLWAALGGRPRWPCRWPASPRPRVARSRRSRRRSHRTPIPAPTIDVAWRAWMPDGGTDWPFSGSPVFIRLVSADGGRSTETDGPREPAGLRALRGHDRHPVRWRGARRGWAVRRVVRRRHLHALRPPVRAPGGPARSAGGGSSPGCAVGDRGGPPAGQAGPWTTTATREDPLRTCRSPSRSSRPASLLLVVVPLALARRTRTAAEPRG